MNICFPLYTKHIGVSGSTCLFLVHIYLILKYRCECNNNFKKTYHKKIRNTLALNKTKLHSLDCYLINKNIIKILNLKANSNFGYFFISFILSFYFFFATLKFN